MGADPDADASRVRPGKATMLWRGLTRRCAVCGRGGLTSRWVQLTTTCPRCGFRFERAPGHFVGAVGMNTVATFGLMLLTIVGGVVLTLPDSPFTLITVLAVGVAIVVPVAFHATAKLVWVAVDLMMNPLEPGEAPLLGTTGLDITGLDTTGLDTETVAEEGPAQQR